MAYDDEFKWCPSCRGEVNYLSGLAGNFCIHCGGEVRMFRDRSEAMRFRIEIAAMEPKLFEERRPGSPTPRSQRSSR